MHNIFTIFTIFTELIKERKRERERERERGKERERERGRKREREAWLGTVECTKQLVKYQKLLQLSKESLKND